MAQAGAPAPMAVGGGGDWRYEEGEAVGALGSAGLRGEGAAAEDRRSGSGGGVG
jgi:hypothetical protein